MTYNFKCSDSKFIKTTLNTVETANKIEIVIAVDGTVGDNYQKKPLERNEPSTSEDIKKKRERFQITNDQKTELVEDYLGLTENYAEDLAIKQMFIGCLCLQNLSLTKNLMIGKSIQNVS